MRARQSSAKDDIDDPVAGSLWVKSFKATVIRRGGGGGGGGGGGEMRGRWWKSQSESHLSL